MLKVYQKIDHKILRLHKAIETLVIDIFCKADHEQVLTKLQKNGSLKIFYENSRSPWFKNNVDAIYKICKTLDLKEKKHFRQIFKNNNKIEYLCSHPSRCFSKSKLNAKLLKLIEKVFRDFYEQLLEWSDAKANFGTKEDYYNCLIANNGFQFCPCCGFGNIKTIYEPGYSSFDHYLPLKHYPFSAVNFDNLFPLCHECNSSYKGQRDILASGKKVFYPANQQHPKINFEVDINIKALHKFLMEKACFEDTDLQLHIVCDRSYQEEIDSWDLIFSIKARYWAQIATNGINWFNYVRKKYRRNQEKGQLDSFENAFDEVIEDDSNEHLGFLKSPFLSKLKLQDSIIRALIETKDSHKIEKNNPIL